jgi:hypothetical protein
VIYPGFKVCFFKWVNLYRYTAGQGLVAGANAAAKALGGSGLVLPREGSYLGTLIDDLCTKVGRPYQSNPDDPYIAPESAWFQPLNLSSEKPVSQFAFQCDILVSSRLCFQTGRLLPLHRGPSRAVPHADQPVGVPPGAAVGSYTAVESSRSSRA